MPVYSWECTKCKKVHDKYATIAERHIGPECCGPVVRIITPAYAVADIAPYIATAGDMAGKEISGRKSHKEYLRRNGLIELGNEKLKNGKADFRPAPGAIREEMKRVVPQVLQKYRS